MLLRSPKPREDEDGGMDLLLKKMNLVALRGKSRNGRDVGNAFLYRQSKVVVSMREVEDTW